MLLCQQDDRGLSLWFRAPSKAAMKRNRIPGHPCVGPSRRRPFEYRLNGDTWPLAANRPVHEPKAAPTPVSTDQPMHRLLVHHRQSCLVSAMVWLAFGCGRLVSTRANGDRVCDRAARPSQWLFVYLLLLICLRPQIPVENPSRAPKVQDSAPNVQVFAPPDSRG